MFRLFGSNACSSLVGRDIWATDEPLFLAHASVDIDVLDLNIERAMGRDIEPGIQLPAEVEKDEEGASEIGLEEGGGVEIAGWRADGVERGVELGDQAEEIHDCADVGSPDAEGSFER